MQYTTENETGIRLVIENDMLTGFDLTRKDATVCECRFEQPTEYSTWDNFRARKLADLWEKRLDENTDLAFLFTNIAEYAHEIKSLDDAISWLDDYNCHGDWEDNFSDWWVYDWDSLGLELFAWLHGECEDSHDWPDDYRKILDSLDGLVDWKVYAKRNAPDFLNKVFEISLSSVLVKW